MKGFIILLSMMFLSVSAFAKNEERSAIVLKFEGEEVCGFYSESVEAVLYGEVLNLRGQYAGGGAGLPSNGSLRCQGTHDLDLDKAIPFHNGSCGIDGFSTDNVYGVISPGGTFLFYCNFPKAPKNYEP